MKSAFKEYLLKFYYYLLFNWLLGFQDVALDY